LLDIETKHCALVHPKTTGRLKPNAGAQARQKRERSGRFHTPSNLVGAHWTSDVESTAPLDFLLRHDLWTPLEYLMSLK
jgi:hypothetical protein